MFFTSHLIGICTKLQNDFCVKKCINLPYNKSIWYLELTNKSFDVNAKEMRPFVIRANWNWLKSRFKMFAHLQSWGRVSKTPVTPRTRFYEKVSGNFLMEKGVTNLAILEATKRQEKQYAKCGWKMQPACSPEYQRSALLEKDKALSLCKNPLSISNTNLTYWARKSWSSWIFRQSLKWKYTIDIFFPCPCL